MFREKCHMRAILRGFVTVFKKGICTTLVHDQFVRHGLDHRVYARRESARRCGQDVLLHSGLSILVFLLAVVMMVEILVIFVVLVMKLFCCFYMQIKSSGYYFTQVIFF